MMPKAPRTTAAAGAAAEDLTSLTSQEEEEAGAAAEDLTSLTSQEEEEDGAAAEDLTSRAEEEEEDGEAGRGISLGPLPVPPPRP